MKLGILVIGQGPRPDLEALLAPLMPGDLQIVVRGCLDGLSQEELRGLAPRTGGDTLYTRLQGEHDIKISKDAVIARAPALLEQLREEDGAEAILFACTGAFPPMRGDAGVVFPSRILAALGAGLLPQGRLGLLVPAPEQIEKLSEEWRRPGVEVVAEALMPSASEKETAAAAARLASRGPDLVAMDCMSYGPVSKAIVQRTLRVPTLLAITATARVLQEVLT